MRVLVVSHENWNNNTNGGNVLSNIFEGLGFDFAQIYCSAGMPNNTLCNKYFQITDKMVIDNVLKRKKIGRVLIGNEKSEESNDLSFENKSKAKRWELIFMAREMIWSLAKIDNDDFVSFIKDFNPDIVFAPCYGNIRMLRLTRTVAKYTDAPIISYVSDDLYSYKVINYNPLYWIRRWNLRRNVRKTAKYYKLMYTMTEEQLNEYEKELNVPMKILRKGCVYSGLNNITKPYRLIYAGNIYLNRSKVLCEIAKSMAKYNTDNINFVLDVYSGGKLTVEEEKILNNGYDTFFKGLINPEDLQMEYKKCDIAIHVENFEKKNAYITRLSFSTKITDCLQSGAAVLAVCPDINAGFKYLENEDCAICVSDLTKLDEEFEKIISDENYLKEYAVKAKNCIEKNHSKKQNDEMILNDFNRIVSKL